MSPEIGKFPTSSLRSVAASGQISEWVCAEKHTVLESERLATDQEAGGSNPLAPTNLLSLKLLPNQQLSSTNDEGSREPSYCCEPLVFGFWMQLWDG